MNIPTAIMLTAMPGSWEIVTCSNTYTAPADVRVTGLCSLPENAPPDEELVITVESGDYRVIGGVYEITPPLEQGGRIVRGRQVQINLLNASPLRVLANWKITVKWLDTVSASGFER